MTFRLVALSTLILTATASAGPAPTADWPQFRGPNRDGLAASRGLARSWPAEGPRVLWKRPIGAAFAGIAVVSDRLYTMASEGDLELALCLDATTGKEIWRQNIGPRLVQEFGDGPRSTPSLDGDTVYLTTGKSTLHALAAADGAKRWSVDLVTTFGAEVPRFGFSSSPLIDGELLILDVGGSGTQSIVAFEKATGKVRWTAAEGPASYSSPIAIEIAGVRQYIFARRLPPAGAEMIALSTSGQLLWRHPAPPTVLVTPTFVAPNRVYISSGDDAGAVLVEVTHTDGAWAAKDVWKNPRFKNHFNASVLVGNALYGFDNATFKGITLDRGEQTWAIRGLGKGSLVSADGLLFVLTDEGMLVLVEANPQSYEEKGRAQVMTGRAWTSPSLAGNRLFVRDQDELVALDVSAPQSVTP